MPVKSIQKTIPVKNPLTASNTGITGTRLIRDERDYSDDIPKIKQAKKNFFSLAKEAGWTFRINRTLALLEKTGAGLTV